MRTLFALILALSFPFAASSCDVSRMGTLEELSRPYVGVYECERLTIGGEDCSDRFDFVRLSLAYGGGFRLTYRTAEGGEGEIAGAYEADPEREQITLSAKTGIVRTSRTFPMRSGAILIDANLLGKLLFAVFRMP